MTKNAAIKAKCLECGGDSPKEVVLCHLKDCPLWPHRLGAGMRSKIYRRRVESAIRRYGKEVNELRRMGYDAYDLFEVPDGNTAGLLRITAGPDGGQSAITFPAKSAGKKRANRKIQGKNPVLPEVLNPEAN